MHRWKTVTDFQKPILLDNARAWRTYLGGSLLRRLQFNLISADDHFPEEWIMSIVEARNPGREAIAHEGLSRVGSDGPYLKELILEHPVEMLGKEHVSLYGSSLGVLVKLIDAAERLTIQVHPDRLQAQQLFHSQYGKTECWHILGTRTIAGEEPVVYLGFKPGITKSIWQGLFENQDIPGMLSCLHRFIVHPGDTILIQGGVPHAIGAGCFLTEIQEPTDLTIRVERTTPSGLSIDDRQCHQGLGFERMFDCFHYDGLSEKETHSRWFIPEGQISPHVTKLIGTPHTNMFSLDMITIGPGEEMKFPDASFFSGLYILRGEGILKHAGKSLCMSTSNQFFLPAVCGGFHINATTSMSLLHVGGPTL